MELLARHVDAVVARGYAAKMNGNDFMARLPESTEQQRFTIGLACWYHSRTEWFDRLHCVAKDGRWRAGSGGGAVPLTVDQRGSSNRHAAACLHAVRWALIQRRGDAVQVQSLMGSVADWTLEQQREAADALGPPMLDVLDNLRWAEYWASRADD